MKYLARCRVSDVLVSRASRVGGNGCQTGLKGKRAREVLGRRKQRLGDPPLHLASSGQ